MPRPLSPQDIEWAPEFSSDFRTTTDLEPIQQVIGQDRALRAMQFGLEMSAPGYNLFVMGREGSGRRRISQDLVALAAQQRAAAEDWVYVDHFTDQRTPRALRLPKGMGCIFRDRMMQLVSDLQEALRTAFQGEEYRTMQQMVEDEFKEQNEQALKGVEESARRAGLTLLRTPMGFAFAPVADGQVLPPEEFQKLSDAEKQSLGESVKVHEAELQRALRQVPARVYAAREKVRELNRKTAEDVVNFLLSSVRDQFSDHAEIVAHLDEMRDDIVANVDVIISALDVPRANTFQELLNGHPFYRRYLVNLLIDRSRCESAPVVFEDEPTLDRLIGTIEHRAEMGMLQTDFHLIRPGALHKANGGYLIVEARKLLTSPYSYEALKRALSAKEIRIETVAQSLGLMPTISLDPAPIPLDVKVLLIGERRIFYMLNELDPEFARLFKVTVDFDDAIKLEDGNPDEYARLIAAGAGALGLKPFTRGAVTQVLWQAARETGDRYRLTTQIRRIRDLMHESDHVAARRGADEVDTEDVISAVLEQIDREGRVPALMRDFIQEGTVAIDSEGAQIGQINGLSVSQIGGLAFGKPTRITARVSLGKGDVVDIEREVELGGPIHTKGVLILSNFLRATFGQSIPLSLQASLVFEQSYGGVDGDSASLAEICTLISSISQNPIQQRFAVTGSINQLGEVQAIGGVNEKIEGFFDICAERGLTGDQGVIIPQTNKRNLVLAPRVTDAVRAGKFHIYALSSVSEAVELLMGRPAGETGPDGAFTKGSVYRDVADRLAEFNALRKAAQARYENSE